jgi:iron complex transport system substrate-binding protein
MDSGRRKIVIAILVVILVVASSVVILSSGTLTSGKFSATVEDASGTNVTIQDTPQRIVSCTPGITEIVCALGLQDKLVAVTDYDDYPAAASQLVADNKTVGGYYDPNFEKIVSYAPDLVILDYGTAPQIDLAKQLRDAGITTAMIYPNNDLEQLYQSIDLVGKLTNTQTTSNQLVADMKVQIADVASKVSDEASKPQVLYATYVGAGFQGFYTTGSGTVIAEIIEKAGGVNMFADSQDWIMAPQEELMANSTDIEVMVVSTMYSGQTTSEMDSFLHSDSFWKNVPAVKNNKVYYLTGQAENVFNRQTVRMVDAVQLMAEMLHPDAFSTKVPSYVDQPIVIGDDYAQYLPSAPSSNTSSVIQLVVASSREEV